MKNLRLLIVTSILSCLISFVSFTPIELKKTSFIVPTGWPQPMYSLTKYPLTEEGFQLGRTLFYDPLLSRDSSVSCASCHNQSNSFTRVDHAQSRGIEGRKGSRNAPALMNLAWKKLYMWDGAVTNIEVLALAPITNPNEMNETIEHVVKKLNASSAYRQQFEKVFGDSVVTGQHLLLAITQFVIQLNSFNAKYDKYIRKDVDGKFTNEEEHGLQLFRQHCVACHTEPLFSNNQFENNGLPVDNTLQDIGRMKVTQNPADSLKFSVPTLRNIEYSAPYMHDGRFTELAQVVNHYASGIVRSGNLSKKLSFPILLKDDEKKDLITFLMTLSDRDYLLNARYSFPKETK